MREATLTTAPATLPLANLHLNDNNPRILKDERFKQLVKSLEEFPEMLSLRPLVVDEAGIVLGGNMRLRAKSHLYAYSEKKKHGRMEALLIERGLREGYDQDSPQAAAHRELLRTLFYSDEVPVTQAPPLSERQRREFIVKDNASFGEWDWDALANGEWGDAATLNEWGLNVPSEWATLLEEEPNGDDLLAEPTVKPATMKITFESPAQLQQAEVAIQELLDRKFPGAYFSVSAGGL